MIRYVWSDPFHSIPVVNLISCNASTLYGKSKSSRRTCTRSILFRKEENCLWFIDKHIRHTPTVQLPHELWYELIYIYLSRIKVEINCKFDEIQFLIQFTVNKKIRLSIRFHFCLNYLFLHSNSFKLDETLTFSTFYPCSRYLKTYGSHERRGSSFSSYETTLNPDDIPIFKESAQDVHCLQLNRCLTLLYVLVQYCSLFNWQQENGTLTLFYHYYHIWKWSVVRCNVWHQTPNYLHVYL